MANGVPEMVEQTFIMTNEQYNEGIAINEYNGTFSFAAVRVVGDAKYIRFCKPEVGRNKFADTRIPMGSRLGNDKAEVAKLLRTLADKLEGSPDGGKEPF